jgi:phosphomevalonate kinase
MISTGGGNRSLIVISGKQLSGKDQLAKILLEKLPHFTRIGLGDAIKIELARQKNISVEQVEQNKHLYRPELIELGNYGRELDNGLYWIKKVLAQQGNLIVPDMRVEKEFETFKKAGAIMVRVETDPGIRAKRGALVRENDPTECALDHIKNWDAIIDNNSDLNNLYKEAEKVISLIPQTIKTG